MIKVLSFDMKDVSYPGQERVRTYIDMLASSHSDQDHTPLLLIGPSGSGKQAAGRRLMEAWSSGAEPPLDISDYTLVMDSAAPSSETDTRYAVYKIRQALSRKALGSRTLLLNFTGAGIPAQNAMLKIMEEPPPLTRIIALQDDTSEILKTIRSRCQVIRFTPLSPQDLSHMAKEAKWEVTSNMIDYARGSLRRLHWLSVNPEVLQMLSSSNAATLCTMVSKIQEDKAKGLTVPQAKRQWCAMLIPMLPAAGFPSAAVIEALDMLSSDYKPEACLALALLTHPQG